jgi:hypothetical protein
MTLAAIELILTSAISDVPENKIPEWGLFFLKPYRGLRIVPPYKICFNP